MLNPLARYPEFQQARQRQLLPVTLIGGFLGAGKTTLLNSLLLQGQRRRLAVLVNDFGELNIDAKLIVRVEGQRIELANGCVCCSIRDDLVAGVERLLMSDPAPEQVLIETSGVSDPGNILCTLKESRVRRGIFLENVITVVDAVHALDAREADYAALFERQLRAAYMLVLNRTQAAGEERTQNVRDMLARLLSAPSIFETADGTAPLALLLGDSRLGQSTFRPAPTDDHGSHPFASMVWRCERPLKRDAFSRAMHALAGSVYRAKGFLHLRHYPLTTLYQKVGTLESYVSGSAWGTVLPRTELVLIGTRAGFDEAHITRTLEACAGD